MLSKPIAKLAEMQSREGLKDREMAKLLGCSRQLWQMTRTGKIPLGNTMLECISRNFPGLHKDVLKFLSRNGDKSSRNADKNPIVKRFFTGLLGRLGK